MNTLFNLLLFLHILAGSISLLIGTLVLALKKGDRRHRLLGKIFYYGMIVNGLASLVLALLHPNPVLFTVGIFSLYMVLTGRRVLRLRQISDSIQPDTFDWFLMGMMGFFGLVSIGMGLYSGVKGQAFGLVSVVFGAIGLLFVRQDITYFKNNSKQSEDWLKIHLTKMMGSYIAAFTAFLVVNNTLLPDVVAWLLPTLVGSALITKWRIDIRNGATSSAT